MEKLDNDPRSLNDARNDEAKKHEGHDVMVVSRNFIPRKITIGYIREDVICNDCSVRFNRYLWQAENPNDKSKEA